MPFQIVRVFNNDETIFISSVKIDVTVTIGFKKKLIQSLLNTINVKVKEMYNDSDLHFLITQSWVQSHTPFKVRRIKTINYGIKIPDRLFSTHSCRYWTRNDRQLLKQFFAEKKYTYMYKLTSYIHLCVRVHIRVVSVCTYAKETMGMQIKRDVCKWTGTYLWWLQTPKRSREIIEHNWALEF